jgi:hypothetical protein
MTSNTTNRVKLPKAKKKRNPLTEKPAPEPSNARMHPMPMLVQIVRHMIVHDRELARPMKIHERLSGVNAIREFVEQAQVELSRLEDLITDGYEPFGEWGY